MEINKQITIFTCIFTFIFVITLSVKLTISFKPLYYFDIVHLNIEEEVKLNKADLKKEYATLINYLNDNTVDCLSLKYFPMSNEGEIHFKEVKNIIKIIDNLYCFSLAIALFSSYHLLKKQKYYFLKLSAFSLYLLTIFIGLLISINFNNSFTIFHNLLFNNDYWLFDPLTDPIIKALPSTFFIHSSILILIIINLISTILIILYKKLNTYSKKDPI